jgi:alkylresorcinol/alkylpyrone synthase
MRIVSSASAFPQYYYPQDTVRSTLRQFWAGRLENPRLFDQIFDHAGVDGRFFCLPLESYLPLDTWGKMNAAWIDHAETLGSQALCRALACAGLSVADIGALLFVSITGVASPSIDAKIVNRLGLKPSIRRMPIFGLGCVGGAACIARAADYVRAYPDQCAAVVSVELCSFTWQRDDLSIANLISTALFGDGAVAVIVAGDKCEISAADPKMPGLLACGPEIIDTRAAFYPNTEDVMGWNISERGFSILLSPSVPDVIREHLREDTDTFLAGHGLTRDDIGCWVLHTGGPKVLEATQDALGLDRQTIAASWDMLRKMGNLSSASVLAVLEEVMTHRRPDRGTWSVLAAMGPGFCSELVLLRW